MKDPFYTSFLIVVVAVGFLLGAYLAAMAVNFFERSSHNADVREERKREKHERKEKRREGEKHLKKIRKESQSSTLDGLKEKMKRLKKKESPNKKSRLTNVMTNKGESWTEINCNEDAIDESEYVKKRQKKQDRAYSYVKRRKS